MIRIIENNEVEEVEAGIQQHIIEPIKLWEDLYNPSSLYADYFKSSYRPVIS